MQRQRKRIRRLFCASYLAGISLLFGVSSLAAQTTSPLGAAQSAPPLGASGQNQGLGSSLGGGFGTSGTGGFSLGTPSFGAPGTGFGSSLGGMSNTGQGGINAGNQALNQGQGQVLGAGSPLFGAGTGNLAYPFYANPLYQGWPGNYGRTAGGWSLPLYQGSTVGTLGSTGSSFGGSSGFGGTGFANINNSMGGGFGGAGGVRRPAVVTTVVFPVRLTPVGQVQSDLRDLFARSSALASNSDVQVHVVGQAVVLRGEVADDRERRLAEAMVRLTPGVREVRNELEVRVVLPAPKPVRH